MGDVEYLDKGGIVLEIDDGDNAPTDKYEDDYFTEANEDYAKTTAEPTVGVPKIRESGPFHPEDQKRKTINRHIPHDQEVEHFKHNYAVGLEDDPVFDCKEIYLQYCISSIVAAMVGTSLSFHHPMLNYFSKEHLREQLLEQLKKVNRNSVSWREAKIKGDPYSELDEKFFHRYSALKVLSASP